MTSLTASTLNSRLNLRLRMTHLRPHETPYLSVHQTGSSSVITPVMVKAAIGENAVTVAQLPPGTQVHLIETVNGWVLIARDRQKVGYVQENAPLQLQ